MIEVTLRDIVNCEDTIASLTLKPFRSKVAYQIAKLIRELREEYALFQDARQKLIEKYGMRDENNELVVKDGNNFVIIPDKVKEFNKEISELLSTTVELNINYLNLDDFEDIDFTPNQMLDLDPFIEKN